VVHDLSVSLTPDLDPVAEPASLWRVDGTGVYRHTGRDHFTRRRVLDAERRATETASLGDRVAVSPQDAELAVLEASLPGGVLRDIAASQGAARLDEVVRFTDPTEAEANLVR
jgi:hypothetical protein